MASQGFSSSPERDDDLISLEGAFAPEEGVVVPDEEEEEDGGHGRGRISEEVKERLKKKAKEKIRGKRGVEEAPETETPGVGGWTEGFGEGAGEGVGETAFRGAGRELGEDILSGAGKNIAKEGVEQLGKQAGKQLAQQGVKAAGEVLGEAAVGAAAGSEVPVVGNIVGAVVGVATGIAQVAGSLIKGEYSKIDSSEMTVWGVALAFFDFFAALLTLVTLPVYFIIVPPMRLMVFGVTGYWMMHSKGSDKPVGLFVLIGKLIGAYLPFFPVNTAFFIAECLMHNKDSEDTLFGDSKQTKKKQKASAKTPAVATPKK